MRFLVLKFWLLLSKSKDCTNNNCEFVWVAGYGRRDLVEFLLSAGASIQARDDGGLHPLHNACSFGHSDVVRLLLEAGANPNTRDNWNYTPLHEAAIKVISKILSTYSVLISHEL